MKKKEILIVIMLLVFIGCVVFLYRNNRDSKKDSNQLPVVSGELLVSSKEGYNSVEIYKQENKIAINAQSDAAFFDGVQYSVETQGEINPEDIEIVWTTLGGGTERTEDNDFIIAEIKITENDALIYDSKINFAKKAFDAVEDVLQEQMK